jgi:hypothetical protein
VTRECIDQPRKLLPHAIHALRLKRAMNDGIIEEVPAPEKSTIEELRFMANSIFYANGTPIRLLHEGETEVLALANELAVSNILMDERTTRMLVEAPFELQQLLAREFRREITVNDEHLQSFSRFTRGMRFFRSSEMLLLAAEKGFFADYNGLEKEAIEAAVYKLKYAGCAVGFGELEGYFSKRKGQ